VNSRIALSLLFPSLAILGGCDPYYTSYDPGPPIVYEEPYTVPVSHVHDPAPADTFEPVSVSDGCAGVPEVGVCDGEYLSFCDDGTLYSYYCPDFGRLCAWDTEYAWFECLPPGVGTDGPSDPVTDPVDTPADDCGGVSFEGMCTSDVLTWCDNGTLVTVDCAETGDLCTFDTDVDYYNCVTPEVPSDDPPVDDPPVDDPPVDDPPVDDPPAGCGDLTFEGFCDGDTATWCENDAVQTKTCENGCAFDDENGYYDCLPAADSDCGDVTFEGEGDGDTVTWCEDGALQSQTCENTCGFDDENGYNTCL